jgi:uncharacterized protein YqjF (DUF2071 family)
VTHPAFAHVDHRPWPLPAGPWTSSQRWCDLLFAHWPVPASVLDPLIPKGTTLQQTEGSAWVGIVPFRMEAVRPRGLPALTWLSAFPELNVRTYVEADGIPGVCFLSLDATQPIAVWGARRFFHLPYHRADISIEPRGRGFRYCSEGRDRSRGACFDADYAAVSPRFNARPGSLDHWLTERYCLYAESERGETFRVEIHHGPWPLQRAVADVRGNSMLEPFGIALPDVAPILHFAKRLDVAIWWPRHVQDRRGA